MDNLTTFMELADEVFERIANVAGTDATAVAKDFAKFNQAIDNLIEEGLTENEAINRVMATWEYNF